MKRRELRSTILFLSVPSLFLAVLHIVCPKLGIDFVSFSFFLLGYLPLFIPFIRSIELPGGTKIDLRDLDQAGNEILRESPPMVSSVVSDDFIAEDEDPNLILVKFRIEIEKRLRRLVKRHGLDSFEKSSAGVMAKELYKNNVLSNSETSGLMALIALGNQAAHGAQVSLAASQWAKGTGVQILKILDEKI